MKNTPLILLIISTVGLPEILHGSKAKRLSENEAMNLRIPEYFDLQGEKLNSLMEMIEERVNMLNANKLKRNEIYKRCFWLLGVILPAYALASIIWIGANVIFYQRQKQKLENGCEGNYILKENQERQRLLERYNQIPSANLPLVNHSTSPATEFDDENLINQFRHSTFQANRARVEAILKLNNEPQFMRRI